MKINLGCGRIHFDDFVNIDIVQYVDGASFNCVDVVMNVEKEKLPYKDGTIEQIVVNNFLEHVDDLRFVLNECHRVISDTGWLHGCVPVAMTKFDLRDPTHRRHFVKETFDYFCGTSQAKPECPGHPKYADYGFKPWILQTLIEENNLIYFQMKPRK